MVQEQPTASGWPTLGTSRSFFDASGAYGTAQQVSLTFCDFSPGGGSGAISTLFLNTFNCTKIAISHSVFHDIASGGYFNNGISINLTNNCFERCGFSIVEGSSPSTFNAYNNLFRLGTVSLYKTTAYNTWTLKDNLLDCDSLSVYDPNIAIVASYNGYRSGISPLSGSMNVTGLAPVYRNGSLGRYYYPAECASGTGLGTLINKGSRTASSAGLAQFSTDGGKDTGTVDIGFHYVATQSQAWIDDSLPTGATVYDQDLVGSPPAWPWVTSNPTPFSGTQSHTSQGAALGNPDYYHQHWFSGGTPTLSIQSGDTIFTYVFIDSGFPTTGGEIMLQFRDSIGNWARAYWGANTISSLGTDGTITRLRMGDLPAVGKWVRLEFPASSLGLEGKTLNAVAFTQTTGKVTWDLTGRGTMNSSDQDGDGLADYYEDTNGDGIYNQGIDVSNFASADTDGDGIPDGVELRRGANPANSQADLIPLSPAVK
jgi:hypothetical protein